MQHFKHILVPLFTVFLLAGCEGAQTGGPISCSMPCIDSAVSLTPSTISTATGATVTVAFHLNGNISEVNNVSILLAGNDPYSPTFPIGSGAVLNPVSNDISIDIPVSSGEAVGDYYPNISITANAPNTGAQYYIDPTKSTATYTYNEVINGSSGIAQLSDIAIPIAKVQ